MTQGKPNNLIELRNPFIFVYFRQMKVWERVRWSVLVAGPAVVLIVLPASAAPLVPEHARSSEVTIWEADVSGRHRFETFDIAHRSGAFLSSGDVDGDGVDELVVGAGPEHTPVVRIYEVDGTLLKEFRVYEEWFRGGVRVAVGDVNADGVDEIITAPGPGMKPLIHLFNAEGEHLLEGGALAYLEAFHGGVRVAVGDFDGNGAAEIVTAPGPGGGPHVRIFNEFMENQDRDFFAFDAGIRDGLTVDVIQTYRGPQIIVAPESWQAPLVRRFIITDRAHLMREFYAFDPESKQGATVAAFDVDADGVDEIVASQNGGTTAEVRIYDMFGTLHNKYLFHDPNYRGALSMTQLNADEDRYMELATVATAPIVVGPTEHAKQIRVNLSQQRLYAYEHGRLANSFLISSGTYKYPTPTVKTEVLDKIPVKRYRWSYGENHPDNYDLDGVQWNLRIYGPYYIHGAFWHNHFGHRMSHGCVNVSYTNAEWIYNWAEVGTAVETHY
ncbi:L,D-transpeptidase family protein [Candidatus Uhrbacteria bacterium]|nr:L,D-transpeptidase family protein [Candidatus Uhrbacteria bacterium]MBD3284199.1 L,D-transpeptidase family protein [Candidatus Uhrbacteria bacterium]